MWMKVLFSFNVRVELCACLIVEVKVKIIDNICHFGF